VRLSEDFHLTRRCVIKCNHVINNHFSVFIHALSQPVCLKFGASCDETPYDLAEGDRYLSSYRRQFYLRCVGVAFP
jgi:hypothetical protein